MINLDTHVLVHAMAGSLTARERKTLSNDSWSISAIVLWELAKLVQLGRLELDLAGAPFRRVLASLQVWPIDLRISLQSTSLDFASDPADEIIAATSIVHQVALVTRDRRILSSRVVPFA